MYCCYRKCVLIDGIHSVCKLVNLHSRVAFISHIRRGWSRQRLEDRDCRRYNISFYKNDIMSAYRRGRITAANTRSVRKVKNVWAYNPRSCFILADESCAVFSRVWTVAWCSSCSKLFHVVSVIGWDNERADIKPRRLWGPRRDSVFAGGER